MKCASIVVVVCAILTSAPAGGGQIGVRADRIMEAAFDLQNAGQKADELLRDAKKHCSFGEPRIRASDLQTAISHHLLKDGSNIPAHIVPSDIWQVAFVAADLERELRFIGKNCGLAASASIEARDLFRNAGSVQSRLLEARREFVRLAVEQTAALEKPNLESLRRAQKQYGALLGSELQLVLLGAREMRVAAESATLFDEVYLKKAGCISYELRLSNLDGLVSLTETIERHPDDHFLLVMEMAAAQANAEEAEAVLNAEALGCWLGNKGRGRDAAQEIERDYTRTVKSIVAFEPLVVRHAQWEESVVGESVLSQEQ